MDRERELISICRTHIEQVLNWGDSNQWANSDFELLSEKIFEKTQVRLSVSTLKRIWGKVKYDNSPTAATLNALARFLDFPSWRDFESTQLREPVTPVDANGPSHTSPEIENQKRERSFKNFARIFSMIAIFIIAAAIIFLLVRGKSPNIMNPSLAKFKSHEVTDDLPNSVIFDYDLSALKSDSAFIQQNWDPSRRQKVSPTGKQHTSVYYTPGYFEAKLIANDSIVKEDIVFIKTKGWKGILDEKPVPIYLSDNDIHFNGYIGFTSEVVKEKRGTSVFNHKASALHNFQEYNVDGADFDYEVSLRNSSTPEESVCRQVQIGIYATHGLIIMPLSTKGCISEIGYLTDQGGKSGKDLDLSSFGVDFTQMEKMTIATHNDTLKVSVNNKVVITEKQDDSIGKIVGLRIIFEGAGEVEYVKLDGKRIE